MANITLKEAYTYFENEGVRNYDFEDIEHSFKDVLPALYHYLLNDKQVPVLPAKSWDDEHYTENLLKYILVKMPEKGFNLLFNIGSGKKDMLRSLCSYDQFLNALPYLKQHEEAFIEFLDSLLAMKAYSEYFDLLLILKEQQPEKHKERVLSFCNYYLLHHDESNHFGWDYYGHWRDKKSISGTCLLILEDELPTSEFSQFLKEYSKNAIEISLVNILYLKKHFGKEVLPYVSPVFDKKIKTSLEYTKVLTALLTDLDWTPLSEKIWEYAAKLELQNQSEFAKLLAEDKENAINLATKFMDAKGGKPTLAYFVLSNIKTEESRSLFEKHFHQEKNDKKVRQIILPTAQNYFYKEKLSLEDVNTIITKAEERGALTWKEAFSETELPALYLKGGSKLSSVQIRFLFYRMAFVTQMQSDPEAKLLLNYIDPEKSNDFASHILKVYLDRGSIAKEKYVMCMAGLLGNDMLLADLQKLFKEVYEAKRMKMTQYVIGTMALIGTDKALRFIEYVSRKFKAKAALCATALESLEIAADELGIDIYELSDRIIPDFGFDGLYKTIQINQDKSGGNDEEMRVFVGKDFKLQYITEDNKIRKSLPKGATKELKDELKIVQKEIREVNRAQKEKLEQYMVLERRWSWEDWEKFYLLNPVMFIYASTLVWGVFDDKNTLVKLFYVDEDTSLLDIEDDEVDITANHKIGIIHPLRTTKDTLTSWTEMFYELEIAQPFNQLDRASFKVEEAFKKDDNISKYNGQKAAKGGRAVQGYFEKRGWRKEVSDGGCFDLVKTFKQEDMYAFLNVQGLCVGYYDEEVEFYDIKFRKIGDWDYKNGFALESLPEIVYSEVIADMEGIIKREETPAE